MESALLLVASRDRDFCARARRALEGEGFGVSTSTDAAQAHASIEESRPALLLLDLEFMEEAGSSLCRSLARQPDGGAVPVLVAAPGEQPQRLGRALDEGASDFVTVPVHWPLLGHRVRRMLDTGRLLGELRDSGSLLTEAQRIANLGSWEWNPESARMLWSEQVYRILGLEPEQVATDFEHFTLCIHPADREIVVAELWQSVREARSFSLAHRVVRNDGSVRYMQVRGESTRDSRVLGTIQDVTEYLRTQEKIRTLAHFDSLTGLANRIRFRERIERAIEVAREKGRAVALLYLDLDQFKRVNDTLGHSSGDQLLQQVADVLVDNVRGGDLVSRLAACGDPEVSRLGGDEFAILLPGLDDASSAGLVARRILHALGQPFGLEGIEVAATASIGIAVFPENGDDAESIIKHADTAMYHAKERGRNNYQFYSESLNAWSRRRLAIETGLRTAVERGEFQLVYQPRVSVPDGRVESMEALLRWTHPELGSVAPKEFICVAEDTGLIVPIGRWVLEQACAQNRAFSLDGYGSLRVSVNVSTRQFVHHDLAETVVRALKETGLPPGQLELEITESALLQQDDDTALVLRELKAIGVKLALDDFGTGYSSLSYLTRFPLDYLKLDRGFVRDVTTDPSALGITAAVVAMAHTLGLRVVAEGVDEQEQAELLEERGCDEIQGFVLSGPLPAADFVRYLQEGRGAGKRAKTRS